MESGYFAQTEGRLQSGRIEEGAWSCGFGLVFRVVLHEQASEFAQWGTPFALREGRTVPG